MPSTTHPLTYESCVDSLEAALAAERCGARRIELCSALDLDGLTPSPELTRQCIEQLSIPVMVMVRPRGGGFVYTEAEVAQMESEIETFKQLGVAGVVFGLLTEAGEVDVKNTKRLVRAALPLEVTFHKAIDYSADLIGAFQTLNAIEGITRVLTSGGHDTAWNGRDRLREMQHLPDRRIKLIAAGKITPENRAEIAKYTGVAELHGKLVV